MNVGREREGFDGQTALAAQAADRLAEVCVRRDELCGAY
jgi:hypothetical protein